MAIKSIRRIGLDASGVGTSSQIAGVTGLQGQPGTIGSPGAPGAAGPAGRSLSSLSVDGNGNLIATYSDGATSNLGPVTVPPSSGADGGSF